MTRGPETPRSVVPALTGCDNGRARPHSPSALLQRSCVGDIITPIAIAINSPEAFRWVLVPARPPSQGICHVTFKRRLPESRLVPPTCRAHKVNPGGARRPPPPVGVRRD